MYMYNWISLLYNWNQQNTFNELYFNINFFKKLNLKITKLDIIFLIYKWGTIKIVSG